MYSDSVEDSAPHPPLTSREPGNARKRSPLQKCTSALCHEERKTRQYTPKDAHQIPDDTWDSESPLTQHARSSLYPANDSYPGLWVCIRQAHRWSRGLTIWLSGVRLILPAWQHLNRRTYWNRILVGNPKFLQKRTFERSLGEFQGIFHRGTLKLTPHVPSQLTKMFQGEELRQLLMQLQIVFVRGHYDHVIYGPPQTSRTRSSSINRSMKGIPGVTLSWISWAKKLTRYPIHDSPVLTRVRTALTEWPYQTTYHILMETSSITWSFDKTNACPACKWYKDNLFSHARAPKVLMDGMERIGEKVSRKSCLWTWLKSFAKSRALALTTWTDWSTLHWKV